MADSVTQEQRDGSATLLVEGHLESTADGVLSAVLVTGEENGETLGGARRVGFAENLDDLGVREPFGNVATGAEALAEFSSGDVEGLGSRGDLVDGLVLVGVGQVGDLLELDDLDTELVLVLLDGVLGVVGTVELDTGRVLAGTGVISSDDEVSGTVILADDGVPDGLTGTTHAHGEGQKTEDGHSVGVTGEEGLVDTDTGEVVDVTGLGETDDGVDQDIGLAGTGGANGQFTVSTVHGVSGLESDNSGPAEFVEVCAELRWGD